VIETHARRLHQVAREVELPEYPMRKKNPMSRAILPSLPALAAGIILLAACGDKKGRGITEPPAPVPGVLTLSLSTANADDRAIIVSVTGPGPIGDITAATADLVLHARSSTAGFKAAIFGTLASGPLVRFAVPDVNKASSYQGTVVEVADSTNALRSVTTGYATVIAK
jgi:hypothetical protein